MMVSYSPYLNIVECTPKAILVLKVAVLSLPLTESRPDCQMRGRRSQLKFIENFDALPKTHIMRSKEGLPKESGIRG